MQMIRILNYNANDNRYQNRSASWPFADRPDSTTSPHSLKHGRDRSTKLKALGLALLVAFAWHAPALAQDSTEERLEQRIRYLEERVAAQDQVIVEKDRQLAAEF